MVKNNRCDELDDQYNDIYENHCQKIVNNCESCEQAEHCPYNPANKDRAESLVSKYIAKGFDSCYIPNGTAFIECADKNVTDGIGESYQVEDPDCFFDGYYNCEKNKYSWEPAQPVFISAQTGQGKNYFIENTLIPYVKELNYNRTRNYKILIISNRLALKNQINKRLNGNNNNDKVDTIQNYKDCVDVVTYQGLLRQKQRLEDQQVKKGKQYLYVICDEAHFFTSDAIFNPDTERILSCIVNTFRNSIRVYMSATPYECLNYIYKEEWKQQKKLSYYKESVDFQYNMVAFYHFNRNYSYLDYSFYSQIEELYDEIINSKKKWLIFIDNKSKCSNLKKILEEKMQEKTGTPVDDKKVIVIDTDSKNDEKYKSLIKKETVDKETSILISTSVLDNGINLNNIDNIVVSDVDIVKCLQMVGRARTKGNERRQVYIQRFNKKYMESRIGEYKVYQEAYHNFELAYDPDKELNNSDEYIFLSKYYDGSEKNWEIAKLLFRRKFNEPSRLYANYIAKDLVDRRLELYDFILEEMKCEDNSDSNNVGQGYLEYQLSWFQKKYCEESDLTFLTKAAAKQKLILQLESYVKQENVFESQDLYKKRVDSNLADKDNKKYKTQDEFSAEFTKLYDIAYGRKDPNLPRTYGIVKINKLLKESELSFIVKSERNKGWYIIKYDWNNENCEKPDVQ